MRILIVEDGRQRGALAAVRSLGRAGHEVGIAAPSQSLAGSSRWCVRQHTIAPPTSPDAAVDVAEVVKDGSYDMVFAVGDAECLSLSAAREQIGAPLGIVEVGPLLAALDKESLGRTAEQLGVRTPQVLSEIPASLPPAGLIVKESVHGQETPEGRAAHSPPVLVRTVTEARSAADALQRAGSKALFQEAIEGDLIAYCVARDREGRTVGEVQQRALRTFPPGAGVSVRAVTTPVDPSVKEACAQLLDELGIWGVAEIQFIAPAQGSPAVIDVNPRFYGSMALAIRAGVDLPVLLAGITAGDRVAPVGAARTGVRYQWLEGDLRRAVMERRGGLPGDIASCLSFAFGAAHSIFSVTDPLPAAGFLATLAGRGGRKLARRR